MLIICHMTLVCVGSMKEAIPLNKWRFIKSSSSHLIICWKFMILFINKANFSSSSSSSSSIREKYALIPRSRREVFLNVMMNHQSNKAAHLETDLSLMLMMTFQTFWVLFSHALSYWGSRSINGGNSLANRKLSSSHTLYMQLEFNPLAPCEVD